MDIIILENLTKLSLTSEERELASQQISSFISSFEKLSEIDTEGVEPLIQVTSLKNILRDDTEIKIIDREELLSNAPQHTDGYFQVPKAIE